MRSLVILLSVVGSITVACSHSATHKQLSGTDSLVIHFNKPGSNTIAQTMSTTEEKAIGKLKQFIDDRSVTPASCNLDGNLLFYRKGELAADVSFTFANDSCRYFILEREGHLVATRLGNEAADFLSSLREGKPWY